MNRYFIPIFLIAFNVYAQYYQAPIDTVLYFKPGKGQNVGQDSVHFPMNIFKLPDSSASEYVGSSSPDDICSLGLGGEIVVGFKNYYIVDAEGPDFTIFENAFINMITKRVFAEPGIVSVSEDGLNFTEFPCDSLSLEGCAGTRPTNGRANPFDPSVSGGNTFDLERIGIKKVRYIKIRDFSEYVLENKSHPFYDPTISGFDLDAVAGLHLEPITSSSNIENHTNESFSIQFKRLNIEIESDETLAIKIFDSIGMMLIYSTFSGYSTFDLSNYPNGVFLIYLQCKSQHYVIKFLIYGERIFFIDVPTPTSSTP
jgi:hypothetical protein